MGACTNCGAAGVDPDHGVCDPCFQAMPLGVWASSWPVPVVTCDRCGLTVAESAVCWHMAVPVCGACFVADDRSTLSFPLDVIGGPVCGNCSDDMGDTFDTWADAVRDGLDTIPCRVCGQTANAGL